MQLHTFLFLHLLLSPVLPLCQLLTSLAAGCPPSPSSSSSSPSSSLRLSLSRVAGLFATSHSSPSAVPTGRGGAARSTSSLFFPPGTEHPESSAPADGLVTIQSSPALVDFLPASGGLYPGLRRELPACGGQIVFADADQEARRRRRGRRAATVQRCHSPLHRSALSQRNACNLGTPPPPDHSLCPDKPILGRRGERPAGRLRPPVTCDTILTRQQCQRTAVARRGSRRGGRGGLEGGVPLANNPLVWELKVEV